MKKMYLAQMQWCEREEPICVGSNKNKLKKESLRILKEVHGTLHPAIPRSTGPVPSITPP
jgi:hypothetical protein